MDGLRSITDNISVIVRFFEQINCLFLQTRWLEQNLANESAGKIALIILIVGFCAYLSFGCGNSTQCNGITQVGIIIIVSVVLVTAFWKRYRIRQQQQGGGGGSSLPTAIPVEEINDNQGYSRVDIDEESNTNNKASSHSSGDRPYIDSYPTRSIEMVAPVSQVVNHF